MECIVIISYGWFIEYPGCWKPTETECTAKSKVWRLTFDGGYVKCNLIRNQCGVWWLCGGCVVECQTFGHDLWGSKPPAAVEKLGQFRSPHVACFFLKRHEKPLVPSTRYLVCQGK